MATGWTVAGPRGQYAGRDAGEWSCGGSWVKILGLVATRRLHTSRHSPQPMMRCSKTLSSAGGRLSGPAVSCAPACAPATLRQYSLLCRRAVAKGGVERAACTTGSTRFGRDAANTQTDMRQRKLSHPESMARGNREEWAEIVLDCDSPFCMPLLDVLVRLTDHGARDQCRL